MAEPGLQLRLARDAAIASLDARLRPAHGAKRLAETDTRLGNGRYRAGWEIHLDVDGERFDLLVMVGGAFPFDPPELYLAGDSVFLHFPHVDEKGKLCLTNAVVTFSPHRAIETTDFLIAEARRLISDSLAGRNTEDFIDEFKNYWRRLPGFSTIAFWSLVDPKPPTRRVSCYIARGFTLLGESEGDIEVWLKNYNGGALPEGYDAGTAVFVWLREPLLPPRYPRTAHDILLLARESAEDADALLQATIPRHSGAPRILLGFQTKNGPVVVGVSAPEPKAPKGSNLQQQRKSRDDGYRSGHVPDDVLMARCFSGTPVSYHDAIQVDARPCLDRGGNGQNPDLLRKRVAIVGCGSLGADVAFMLARSGVGEFVLIDNEVLTWGNVARHALGGESVGHYKASALKTCLSRKLPWITATAKPEAVEGLVYKHPKELQECDLIISTTGDWTGDCILNSAFRTFARFPPVLFGWTEAYGFAGQALAVLRTGGCLACGTTEFGVFEARVTEWPEGHQPLVQATGCSDLYQPYGVADVAPTKAIITELALDVLSGRTTKAELRTWIGNTQRLRELGGQFGPEWRDKVIPGESDRRIFVKAWPVNPNCPLCN